jgi:hypothetical protein
MNIKIMLALAFLLVFQPLHAQAEDWRPTSEQMTAVEKSASAFLMALTEKRYKESYVMLEPMLKSQVSEEQWAQIQESTEKITGGGTKYIKTDIHWSNNPADAPLPGTYAVLDLKGKYNNIPQASELLVMHEQSDHTFLVMRYEKNLVDQSVLKKSAP